MPASVAGPVNQVMITLVPVTVATSRPVTSRSVVEALADPAETRPDGWHGGGEAAPEQSLPARGSTAIHVRHSVAIWRNVQNAKAGV
jgi:hypothetical protein